MAIELYYWDKMTGFTYPNGKAATVQDINKEFPFTADPNKKVVIEYLDKENNVIGAIDDLDILKQVFSIEEGLSDEDTLNRIMEIRNTPPPEPIANTDPESIRSDVDYLLMLNGGM